MPRTYSSKNNTKAITTARQWADYQVTLARAAAIAHLEAEVGPIPVNLEAWHDVMECIDVEAELVDLRSENTGYPHGKNTNMVIRNSRDYMVQVALTADGHEDRKAEKRYQTWDERPPSSDEDEDED